MSETLDYEQQLSELTSACVKLANKYAVARKQYGECKAELDIRLTGKIISLLEKKKNLGYEAGLLMMIAENPELGEVYKKMITCYNNYKAIERMIDAYEAKTMSIQSIMKYNKTNDGGM